MKPYLLAVILLFLTFYSFCQTSDSSGRLRDSYYRKGRVEITTSIVMASVGTGMVVYSVAKGASVILSFLKLHPEAPPKNIEAIAITGNLLVLGSIPVLIIGNKNRKKAMRMTFNMQKAEVLLPAGRVNAFSQPSLALTVNILGRNHRH